MVVCLPQQKLEHANKLQKAGHRVIMVGDGINDVPVLSGADASVALGDATDFARIHADSILLSSNLDTLPQAIALARRTRRVIQQIWVGHCSTIYWRYHWLQPV